MINRVYLKECLSFNEVDLEFKKGLNIFTGPSGAGKSILMQAILSLFALADVKANLGEIALDNLNFTDESYDISYDDEIVIKSIKKEKKSIALELTTKRLQLLSNQFNRNFYFDLINKKELNNDQSGVLVNVYLPLTEA